jgi:hypothetical protein
VILRDKLLGKYVTYLWKPNGEPIGSYRTHKVVRISGRTLTVKDATGTKHRIHPKTTKILGRQYPKQGLEKIQWK